MLYRSNVSQCGARIGALGQSGKCRVNVSYSRVCKVCDSISYIRVIYFNNIICAYSSNLLSLEGQETQSCNTLNQHNKFKVL